VIAKYSLAQAMAPKQSVGKKAAPPAKQ